MNKYAPLKKVSKHKLLKNSSIKRIHKGYFSQTVWIVLGPLFYGNKTKRIYYTKYFENNWNNIKNTWKGIKIIISIKNITATVPNSIEFNNKTITDPTAMTNVFNNYFTSIAKKTNSNIKFLPIKRRYYKLYFILTVGVKKKLFVFE